MFCGQFPDKQINRARMYMWKLVSIASTIATDQILELDYAEGSRKQSKQHNSKQFFSQALPILAIR